MFTGENEDDGSRSRGLSIESAPYQVCGYREPEMKKIGTRTVMQVYFSLSLVSSTQSVPLSRDLQREKMALTNEKDDAVLQLEKTDSSDGADGRFDENAHGSREDWTAEEERKLV